MAAQWLKTLKTSVRNFFINPPNDSKRRRDDPEERHVNGVRNTVASFDLPYGFEEGESAFKKFKETQPSRSVLQPRSSNIMDEKARKPNGHVPTSYQRNYARKPISNGEPVSTDPTHRSFGDLSRIPSFPGVDASHRSALNDSGRSGASVGARSGPLSSGTSVRKPAVKNENEEIQFVGTTNSARKGTTNSTFKVPHTNPPPPVWNSPPSVSSTRSSIRVPDFREITRNQPKLATELYRQQQKQGQEYCASKFPAPLVAKRNLNTTLPNGIRQDHHKSTFGSKTSLSSSGSANDLERAVTKTTLESAFVRNIKERIAQKTTAQPAVKAQPTKASTPQQSPNKVVDVITLDDEESVKVVEAKSPLKPWLDQIVGISKKRDKELLRVARAHGRTSIRDDLRNYGDVHDEWPYSGISQNLDETFEKITERVKQLKPTDLDFIDLSDEEEKMVNRAFASGAPTDVMSDKFRLQVTRKDLATLKGQNWLNDEVCNFYLEMIVDRAARHSKKFPKVYTYNTFFYTTLLNKGYDSVKRWTKKVNIFDHDLLLVPVHLGSHWCLAVIDTIQQTIRYYDSLGKANYQCAQILLEYLEREKQDKQKQSLDSHNWQKWFSAEERKKPVPLQNNGSDCGVFMLKFADYAARKAEINFEPDDMSYFRRRICWEILQQKLMGT